jgi:hypothetical protein
MSDTPMVVEVNCETGEVTERPYTADEIAAREVEIAKYAELKAAEDAEAAATAAAKASASTKLSALGLSEAEITALTK